MNARRVVDRVLFLRGHPAFRGLPLEQLLAVARRCTAVTIPAGAHVANPHGPDHDTLLFVTEGSLEIDRPEGSMVVPEGDAAGLLHLLAGRRVPPVRGLKASPETRTRDERGTST